MSWLTKALCAGLPPHDFDLAASHKHASREGKNEIARRLCDGCPVIGECADDALEHRDFGVVRAGVWLEPGSSGLIPSAGAVRRLRRIARENGGRE